MHRLFGFAIALALASAAAFAAPAGVTLSPDKRSVTVPHAGAFTPSFTPRAAYRTIFSNIGVKYPKGLYFCCYGATISGPDSGIGQNWYATAFTPTTDATATELDAGVGYIAGTNGVVLGLYADDNGVPGKALGTGIATGLGTFGTCCTLALVNLKTGVQLTANTQYWFAVTTNSKQTTAFAADSYNSSDEVDALPIANDTGGGWTALGSASPAVSFGIYGR